MRICSPAALKRWRHFAAEPVYARRETMPVTGPDAGYEARVAQIGDTVAALRQEVNALRAKIDDLFRGDG